MATYTNLPDLFGAIADSIRSKTGGSADIVADDFPTEISGIVIPTVYPVIVRNGVTPYDANTIIITAGSSQDFSVYNRAVALITPSTAISVAAHSTKQIVLHGLWSGTTCNEVLLDAGSRIGTKNPYTATGTAFLPQKATLKTTSEFLTNRTYTVVLWRD